MGKENLEERREHFEEAFGSVHETIERIEAITIEKLEALGCGKEATEKFALAVREAAANAVDHGNGRDPSKKVTFTFDFDPTTRESVVAVMDEGEGFELDDVPDPTREENLLKTSGRGIFIMREFGNAKFEDRGRKVILRKTFGDNEE